MLKQILVLLVLTFSVSPLAQAKVIELSTVNPDKCRQTILGSGVTRPVIFMYMKNCPWADKLRPIYEAVANEFPERAFFAYNFNDDSGNSNYVKAKTAQECFGTLPNRSPSIYVYNIMPSSTEHGFPGYFFGEDRMGLDGSATKEDLIRFLGLRDPKQAQHYTLLSR